jgi:uncharacterized protein YbbK (DUF523 family)
MPNTPELAPALPRLLISACLLGNPVRYDGQSKPLHHAGLQRLQAAGRLFAFCPEMAGGLPVPRAPAEIVGGDGTRVIAGRARVMTQAGEDVSAHFVAGAERALALCRQQQISIAVLTESSPSCGSGQIYDGSFNRRPVPASGVTTAMLRQHGIRVFSQHQLEQALQLLLADENPLAGNGQRPVGKQPG